MAAVHISPYSGTWYPAQPAELDRLLEERFESSRRRTGPYLLPNAVGFVVPHAAPEYSGVVAASVYRSLRQQNPERIVLLAFPHRGGLRGVAVPDIRAISTPLGSVLIDEFRSRDFARVPESLLCDHSFEIQLPFLQKVAPRARLCPLYVGNVDEAERHRLAEALATEWRPGTVFLASSDFTHYGRAFGYMPFPADDRIAHRLRDLDTESMEAAGSLDADLFLSTLERNGSTVCGSEPIALLLSTLRLLCADDLFQAGLDYQTSGELTGDFRHTVSYAALGYFPRSSFQLSSEDGEALLTSAGLTLQRLRETGIREPVRPRGSPALESRRGVFVSIHRSSELLGCMGHCESHSALADDVPDLALVAALEDPRFPPGDAVKGAFDIEISLLTPLRRIRNPELFRIGLHGGVLRVGPMGGLLLPQVARPDWSAMDFFHALTRKSALPLHAYEDAAAKLYVFEADVFRRQVPK